MRNGSAEMILMLFVVYKRHLCDLTRVEFVARYFARRRFDAEM